MVMLRAEATELVSPAQMACTSATGRGRGKRNRAQASLAARQTCIRSAPLSAEDMAAPAVNVDAMGAALWEAANEGATAEARRLLDAGAPCDWKHAAAVSVWRHGVVLPSRRAC